MTECTSYCHDSNSATGCDCFNGNKIEFSYHNQHSKSTEILSIHAIPGYVETELPYPGYSGVQLNYLCSESANDRCPSQHNDLEQLSNFQQDASFASPRKQYYEKVMNLNFFEPIVLQNTGDKIVIEHSSDTTSV